jgi:hypothetical protein
MYEDPQIAMARPVGLAVNPPAPTESQKLGGLTVNFPSSAEAASPGGLVVNPPVSAEAAKPAGLVVQPKAALQATKPVGGPAVSSIVTTKVDTPDITVSQEYVNKVVQSLGSLRSAVVSRRLAPVLNERSFR